jgi:hypothetical protein
MFLRNVDTAKMVHGATTHKTTIHIHGYHLRFFTSPYRELRHICVTIPELVARRLAVLPSTLAALDSARPKIRDSAPSPLRRSPRADSTQDVWRLLYLRLELEIVEIPNSSLCCRVGPTPPLPVGAWNISSYQHG